MENHEFWSGVKVWVAHTCPNFRKYFGSTSPGHKLDVGVCLATSSVLI